MSHIPYEKPLDIPIPSLRCLSAEECQAWRGEHVSRREWKRQLTCHTPLERLPWFTGELVRLLAPFDRALLIIDLIVFDVPAELEALRRAAGETRTIPEAPGHVVEGDPEGFRRLLEVVLSDWVDFRVVFSPSRHALRADHDEHTTFFSMSPGRIAEVRKALAGEVYIYDDWTAKPP